jgi:cation diffusion facilitator CzcD-associated flavoprotein CzcO
MQDDFFRQEVMISLRPQNLEMLESQISHDLESINFPEADWIENGERALDVAIIGGGMAGLAAGFSLKRLGINKLKIFDACTTGHEGPWGTYARMKTLRSTKGLTGPVDVPSLTFRAWYEARHGYDSWQTLGKIPTEMWMDYLKWFRKVLTLPVENEAKLISIEPNGTLLKLKMAQRGQVEEYFTKKLVLATGRAGFGGVIIPSVMNGVPKEYYAHTNEMIDFEALKGKRLGIIGAGAAGFDAAATALEKGAEWVDLLIRRSSLPYINKFASITYSGFTEGYNYLKDEDKLRMISIGIEAGATPPVESLIRIAHFKNVKLRKNVYLHQIHRQDGQIQVETNRGIFNYDYLILATGYCIDGSQQPELQPLMPLIKLWGDQASVFSKDVSSKPYYRNFPYLGFSFEFLEKKEGTAPFLKNIHCFNFAATLSHGLLSSDIPGIGAGAARLARGIAKDFFTHDSEKYIERLKNYSREEFQEENFDFIEKNDA